MTKDEAKSLGLTQYDGSPCGKCGSTIRRTCNGGCQACHVDRIKVRERKGGDLYEKRLERNTKAAGRRKEKVFAHYGKQCAICGFSDMRALSIDHVNQDGAKHTNGGGKTRLRGQLLYRWLVVNNFPDGFRTLCGNCQSIEYAKHDGRDENNRGGSQKKGMKHE